MAAWLLRIGPRISADSYARIQLGMTRDEVQAIIGVPDDPAIQDAVDLDADRYYGVLDTQPRSVPAERYKGPNPWGVDFPYLPHDASWTSDRYSISVDYDRDGRVIGKALSESSNPSWWTRTLIALGID